MGISMRALLALLACVPVSSDKAITAAGVTVKVKGQSGKMTLTIPTNSNTSNDTSIDTMDVECQMVALRQLDVSNNTLGGGGSEKHSFNSFATQEFSIGVPTEGSYENIAVASIRFESTLVGSSKVMIDTMIFTESGQFTVGTDVVNVNAGTVKFNVMLSNWSWCGTDATCKASAGDGDSVELDLRIEADGMAASAKGGMAFDLGGGSELLMLNTYSIDNGESWTTMPAGYPSVDGSTFTLRFPRWNDTVIYDPVFTGTNVDPDDEEEVINPDTGSDDTGDETTSDDDDDDTISGADVSVRVEGQSGKMTVTIPAADSGSQATEVECQIVALRQLDSDDNILGRGGSDKHSFNSFATQNFTIGDTESSTYDGVAVTRVSFESLLGESSLVKIDLMIFLESGTFSVGGEEVGVKAGSVKFNVLLSNWSWCGDGATCVNGTGDGDVVELDLSVAAIGHANASRTRGHMFDLGGGTEVLMLDTYSIDEGQSWTSMPSGYPELAGSVFTLRFPRWNGTLIYDPVIASEDSVAFNSGAMAPSDSLTVGILIAVFSMASTITL